MATCRNFSMSGINSGHHNIPTYEISLKSDNVEFVRYCGGHFENGDRQKFFNVGTYRIQHRQKCKTGKSPTPSGLVSEISLSCTFCQCLILFLTFISCFQFRVCLCTFSKRSCKQCELFPLHVNQKSSSIFLCIA